MKVAVLGASGILGQHLMISVPPGIEAVFTRRRGRGLYREFDVHAFNWPVNLHEWEPNVIINLIGENSPDRVQVAPTAHEYVNLVFPRELADWSCHLIHVSSQAVLDPVNAYGEQKQGVDDYLLGDVDAKGWTIVRPTFVLGIRPFPAIGRENPAERILAGRETHSVDNRYFAVSFAWDVVELLWRIAQEPATYRGQEINAGNPERVSRYSLAKMLGANPEPITQEHAEKVWGIAPRPMDTSGAYADAWKRTSLEWGITDLKNCRKVMAEDAQLRRIWELAAFFKIPAVEAEAKIMQGFGTLHNAVTEDFNHAVAREVTRTGEGVGTKLGPPATDTELLEWYRTTDKYIFELTAYHCDPGFNYAGMCKGILETLKGRREFEYIRINKPGEASEQRIYKPFRVLCLGDGVGSLTIVLKDGGLEPMYHDLAGSRTAAFAAARFEMRFADQIPTWLTEDFRMPTDAQPCYDAVVSLDYLEHCPNVEEQVRFVWQVLKPGGLFFAQNAFNCGSGPDGAIPQHLACNDHFEKDWDPLLSEIGFVQLGSNNYEKPI